MEDRPFVVGIVFGTVLWFVMLMLFWLGVGLPLWLSVIFTTLLTTGQGLYRNWWLLITRGAR
jgi:hypothetical protein